MAIFFLNDEEEVARRQRALSDPRILSPLSSLDLAVARKKQRNASVPCIGNLHSFPRTTIETGLDNHDIICNAVDTMLKTSLLSNAIQKIRFDEDSFSWSCECHIQQPEGSSEILVKFIIQMVKRKITGNIFIEWRRLSGTSPIFFDLYHKCRAELLMNKELACLNDTTRSFAGGSLICTNESGSGKKLTRCRSDTAAVMQRRLSNSQLNNSMERMGLGHITSPLPLSLSTVITVPDIDDEEYIRSLRALEAWMEKDPSEAKMAAKMLSVIPLLIGVDTNMATISS